ncbi:dethiobiotin synthase [Pseudarthrobacter raffinosi]|uniref:dethiobiotin synthase n=1 Tax=Pseudarthrobacter raffinosi TaxID=2953651 RepID=UPI00208E8D62|nr:MULTISPECIES: dethiobiotin synthase [unclassified Pseudarthrobacter]MCO4236393.1 dethiobiotin synthase [Pseudarthrobacter sp. MDT3-28]MCO4253412.1 dethiobiotin synthase [Pseudarthrobacter sp. MDT3-9]MCO4262318.1 dethiobiotin synthase [Pseudarthrobacter sp. MDT3-26]
MNLPGIILVTGTDTGVGKTITTAALAAVLHGTGRSVAVYKPCQSGAADGDSDAAEIVRLAGAVTAETGVVLQEPLAPVAAAAVDGTPLPTLAAHAKKVRELAASHDHVLVEGAGGLLVELDSDGGTLAELGSLLAAAFVLVARPGLGTLNHTALTLEALDARDLQVLGVVLGSWPGKPDFVHHSNRQVLDSLRAPLLGALPEQASELPPAAFRAGAAAWLNGLPA